MRENTSPTNLKSEKVSRCPFVCIYRKMFFFESCMIHLAPSVSESSPKGNDFELWDKTCDRKGSLYTLRLLIDYNRGLSLKSRRHVIARSGQFGYSAESAVAEKKTTTTKNMGDSLIYRQRITSFNCIHIILTTRLIKFEILCVSSDLRQNVR